MACSNVTVICLSLIYFLLLRTIFTSVYFVISLIIVLAIYLIEQLLLIYNLGTVLIFMILVLNFLVNVDIS